MGDIQTELLNITFVILSNLKILRGEKKQCMGVGLEV
jgi:hypothetical protein